MKKNIILKVSLIFYVVVFCSHVYGQNQLFKYDLEYKASWSVYSWLWLQSLLFGTLYWGNGRVVK